MKLILLFLFLPFVFYNYFIHLGLTQEYLFFSWCWGKPSGVSKRESWGKKGVPEETIVANAVSGNTLRNVGSWYPA